MTQDEYNALKLGDSIRVLDTLSMRMNFPQLVNKFFTVDKVECSKTSVTWGATLSSGEVFYFDIGDVDLASAPIAFNPHYPHICPHCYGPAYKGAVPADLDCLSGCSP